MGEIKGIFQGTSPLLSTYKRRLPLLISSSRKTQHNRDTI
jgi:hypothetical protein